MAADNYENDIDVDLGVQSDESEGLLGEDSDEEETKSDQKKVEKRNIALSVLNNVFPLLTTGQGEKKLSRKRSIVILLFLYASHSFSAWGDRMWNFANSLFIALLYPGSLLLPGVFGFIMQLFVVIFGTIVGDWVDTNRRLKVIWMSLIIQNTLVAINTILLSIMFYYSLTVCNNIVLFGVLVVGVVLLGAFANLATVANTIAVERDWVVVIADKNSSTLAILNANMRRIDLACKLLAPIVAGVLMTHTSSLMPSLPADMAGGFIATVFIGVWNVVSFFAELSLLYIVYRLLPTLMEKKLRIREKEMTKDQKKGVIGKQEGVKGEQEGVAGEQEGVADGDQEGMAGEQEFMADEKHVQEVIVIKRNNSTRSFIAFLKKLATPYWTLRNGWGIFWRQEINLVGFAMASLYLTVLGFSGVTATYFLTQGVTSDLIGLFQGMGGIFGIAGTIAYPFLHRKLGTVKTGIVGNVLQVLVLTFSVVGVFIPGRPLSDNNESYYSVNCSSNISPSPSPTIDLSSPFPSSSIFMSPSSSPSPSPSSSSFSFSINPSVALVLVGVTAARFGLWIFDLAVSQLIQERVVEEERGVVSGVMKAMNSNMDMIHYVMVIIAPRPQEFPYLAVISFASVTMGMIFYLFYVRRVEKQFCGCCKPCCTNKCAKNNNNNTNKKQEQSIINDMADNYDL